MVKVRRVSATLMDKQNAPSKSQRPLSPRALERQKQERQFERLLRKLRSPDDVFEIDLGPEEKAVTVRQRLLQVARGAAIDVAVRRRENGFLVGLMTPDRKERRGRRSSKTTAAG
jgi:hypothetical protein